MADSREEQLRMARQLRSEFGIGGGGGGGRGVGRGGSRGGRGGRGGGNLGRSQPQTALRGPSSVPLHGPSTGRAQRGGCGLASSRPFGSFQEDWDDNVEPDDSSSNQSNPLIVYYNDEPAPVPKKARVETVGPSNSTSTSPTFAKKQANVAATANFSTIPREPVFQPAQPVTAPLPVQPVAVAQLPSFQQLQAGSAAMNTTSGTELLQPTTAFNGQISAFPHPQAHASSSFPASSMPMSPVFNHGQQHQQQPVSNQILVDNAPAFSAVPTATGIVMQGSQPLVGSAVSFNSAPVVETSYQDMEADPKPELAEVETAVNMSKDQSIIWYYNEEPPRPLTPKPAVEDSPVKYSNVGGFGYHKRRRHGNDTSSADSIFDDSSPPAGKPPPVFYLDEQPGPDSAAQDPNCICGRSVENLGLFYSRHACPGQQLSQQGNFVLTSCPVHFNQEHIYGEGYLTRDPAML